MRKAIAAALLAIPAAAAADTGTSDVIGGTITPEGEYDGVGALYVPSLGGAMCTGTLIAPTVVLTAAHCVDQGFLGGEIPGFTLAHDATIAQPVVAPGMRVMQHESFDLFTDPGTGIGTWYDIGLLFLAQPIDTVDPIRIPTLDEAAMLAVDTPLELVGYGVRSTTSQDVGVMYDAIAPIVAAGPAELQISHPGEAQNCYGDSGGPALIDLGHGYRVVGVVSRSASGSECTQGGVDTRVDFYTEWLYTNAMVCAPGDERCPDNELDDGGGCCSTSRRSPTGSLLLALSVLGLLRRGRGRSSSAASRRR
jgi:hypothetical protein